MHKQTNKKRQKHLNPLSRINHAQPRLYSLEPQGMWMKNENDLHIKLLGEITLYIKCFYFYAI